MRQYRGINLDILTAKEFGKAISYVLNIRKEEAEEKANILMDFFGYEERIIDNCISPKERQLFYSLEREGLLITDGEKVSLPNRKTWRIRYWQLDMKNIKYYAGRRLGKTNKEVIDEIKSLTDNIYLHLPQDMWFSRKDYYLN